MNLSRNWKTLVIGLIVSISYANVSTAAPLELKPNILAVCHSLLTAAPPPQEDDVSQAWRQVQGYMAYRDSSMVKAEVARGSKDLRAKRRIQVAEMKKLAQLDQEFGQRQFQTEPTVRVARVISGSDEILNFVKQQEDAEQVVQAEIDKLSPPLSLSNYVRNLVTPRGLRRMIAPTIWTTAGVAAIVGSINSMMTPHPVIQTELELGTTVVLLGATSYWIYRMGKAIAALGNESLRIEWENFTKTRTDDLATYFSNISRVLVGGNNGPFEPKHVTIRQPITSELYERCNDFIAGDYDDGVKAAVVDSLRLGNSLLPKEHYFAVDLLFQYSNDEPTLTLVGRCH